MFKFKKMSSADNDGIIKIPKIKIIVNKCTENKEEIKNINIKKKSDLEILVESVNKFLNEKLIITSNREDRIYIKEIYENFNIWYSDKEQIEKSSYTFGKAMKRNGINNIRNSKGIFYICIKYKNEI